MQRKNERASPEKQRVRERERAEQGEVATAAAVWLSTQSDRLQLWITYDLVFL